MDPCDLTAAEAAAKLHDGSLTAEALTRACLARCAAREPEVKAFSFLDPDLAIANARRVDKRYDKGVLHGLPVGVKDMIDACDMPTSHNSPIYEGLRQGRDAACVAVARGEGAVIFGKTDTVEFAAGGRRALTRNPHDLTRTPGGSSSGSAAAVGAGMLPAALGTQVGGSIIRPAAYCANVALKPSQGAIHRGERQTTSQSTHGMHAGCIEDVWLTMIEIARRVGGDPGRAALTGPTAPPAAQRPDRLIVMETEGWASLDAPSRAAFEALLDRLAAQGIAILRRDAHPLIGRFEAGIAEARAISAVITGWENRWYQRAMLDIHPGGISARGIAALERAEALSLADYETALAVRAEAQARHARIAPLADAVIALACPGPAPLWPGDAPGAPLAPRPTGDVAFNTPSSMLFAPAVTVPLLAVGGMPVGVQIMTPPGEDARAMAIAGWLDGMR